MTKYQNNVWDFLVYHLLVKYLYTEDIDCYECIQTIEHNSPAYPHEHCGRHGVRMNY